MATTCTPSASLSRQVTAGCDENAYKCYQCKKCTSGCPVARYADMHPAMIMRAVQLGQYDMIFDDRFIWLCTGCETCTTRCPQGIDIATIMDELKIMARKQGRIPAGTPSAPCSSSTTTRSCAGAACGRSSSSPSTSSSGRAA